ncbi:sensor histidine kinase RegB [Palleronia pelagia]|uniref:histidine kinase n=1 Tax=Palleronia pelagia TaxID=387096 RepID=A0A1H8F612_9RHOB|nr:ActS/PrrB/RegB family redox-sensitive histidine kinase [Palleronia pelagia]SEN27135.1 two-component system, sensor histidine kinase RegB [Palleronia pelagia]
MTQTDTAPDFGPNEPIFAAPRRSNWVRLRTMILLRWIAIAGQVVTVILSLVFLDLALPTGLIAVTIAVAVITNVAAALIYPENKRLNETGLAGVLVFDMVHLSTLLMLTGGLNNPFASLILAQVAISAAVLRLNATLLVCVVAVGLTTTNFWVYVPLSTTDGAEMHLPPLFRLGFWAAICIGVIFQAAYARRVTLEMTAMADALQATQMALAREQKLTDLGGVVAAAAHELGTPLSTIALVSGEMLEELGEDSDLRDDARLIRDQAERCRMILHSMGRAGKQDSHMRHAPLSAVLEEAAEPHGARGVELIYDLAPTGAVEFDPEDEEPVILRRPEVVHGLRNLIQNAVDFARSRVWIDARWSDETINLRIADDGPGFPPDLLPVLGDPFMRSRNAGRTTRREDSQGMGLGLFIAKTLLERSGAELVFANGVDQFTERSPHRTRTGAIVTLRWSRAALAAESGGRGALGDNQPTDI